MRQRVALVLVLTALIVMAVASSVPLLAWRLDTSLTRTLRAESVDVHLGGGPASLLRGRFPRVALLVRRAPAGGLVVDELDAQLQHVRLALAPAVFFGRFVVRDLKAGLIAARIRDTDLRDSLQQRRYIESAHVRFDDGVVAIAGIVTVAGARVEASLVGEVMVRDGRELVLRVRTLEIVGLSLPAGMANTLAAPLNPLLRADRLPVPLRFVDVLVDDGLMMITAEAP